MLNLLFSQAITVYKFKASIKYLTIILTKYLQ